MYLVISSASPYLSIVVLTSIILDFDDQCVIMDPRSLLP
jgi:hypothetical protein